MENINLAKIAIIRVRNNAAAADRPTEWIHSLRYDYVRHMILFDTTDIASAARVFQAHDVQYMAQYFNDNFPLYSFFIDYPTITL